MTEQPENQTDAVTPDPEPVADDDGHVDAVVVEQPDEREPDPSTEQRTSAAVVPYERPTPLVPGVDVPIIPAHQEMQGMAAMAVTLAGANAVPAALRGKPNDVFQILLTARDLGVAVTTGMREFHVIEGKVTLSPKVKLALVNERGRREGWACWPDPANDENSATWYATRRDRPGLTFSSTFTMDEARRIKNGSKTLAEKENWVAYPKRMLSWRSLGYLLDDVFPEVGTGLYSPDELGAMTDENGDVIDIQTTDPLPGTKAPKGHGPSAPSEGDQPLCEADPDLCTDLRARLDAIGTVTEARTALVTMWRAGENALPLFDELLLRHKVRAVAMIQGIEARLRKGEWGPWAADPMDAPADQTTDDDSDGGQTVGTPETPDEPSDGDAEQLGTCETCGAADGEPHLSGPHDFDKAMGIDTAGPPTEQPSAPDPEAEARLVQQVIAEVKALTKGKVVGELARKGYKTSRDDAANRRALGAVLLRERGGHVPDHDMPPLADPDPDVPQTTEPLPLAPADRAAGERDEG